MTKTPKEMDLFELWDYEQKLNQLKKKEQHAKTEIEKIESGKILEKVLILAIKEIPTIQQLDNVRYLLNNEIKMRKILKKINTKQ